jgi:pimeloyl-ACP methyl ester carboxylesterase
MKNKNICLILCLWFLFFCFLTNSCKKSPVDENPPPTGGEHEFNLTAGETKKVVLDEEKNITVEIPGDAIPQDGKISLESTTENQSQAIIIKSTVLFTEPILVTLPKPENPTSVIPVIKYQGAYFLADGRLEGDSREISLDFSNFPLQYQSPKRGPKRAFSSWSFEITLIDMIANHPEIPKGIQPGYIYNDSRPTVILVHGALSTPDKMKTLGERFEKDSDTKGKFNVLYFHYYTAENIEISAKLLVDEIERLKLSEVYLIAHSMGGIVCRCALEKIKNLTSVKKVILLGTPNHGTASECLRGTVNDVVSLLSLDIDPISLLVDNFVYGLLTQGLAQLKAIDLGNAWLEELNSKLKSNTDFDASRYITCAGKTEQPNDTVYNLTGPMLTKRYGANDGFVPVSSVSLADLRKETKNLISQGDNHSQVGSSNWVWQNVIKPNLPVKVTLKGKLTVKSDPSGAFFKINETGYIGQTPDAVELPYGSYSIIPQPLDGYITPDSETVTIDSSNNYPVITFVYPTQHNPVTDSVLLGCNREKYFILSPSGEILNFCIIPRCGGSTSNASLSLDRQFVAVADFECILIENLNNHNGLVLADADNEDFLPFYPPRLSPDNKKVMYTDVAQHLRICDFSTDDPTICFNWFSDFGHDWSPDGSKIVIANRKTVETSELLVISEDGVIEKKLLVSSSYIIFHPRWSSDGTKIKFEAEDNLTGDKSLYIIDLEGNILKQFKYGPDFEAGGIPSPDFKYVILKNNSGFYLLDVETDKISTYDSIKRNEVEAILDWR